MSLTLADFRNQLRRDARNGFDQSAYSGAHLDDAIQKAMADFVFATKYTRSKDGFTTAKETLSSPGNLGVTAPSTFTRASGSFTTDGVEVDDTMVADGFTNAANNHTFTVATVGTTTLTVTATTLTTESAASGRTLTFPGETVPITISNFEARRLIAPNPYYFDSDSAIKHTLERVDLDVLIDRRVSQPLTSNPLWIAFSTQTIAELYPTPDAVYTVYANWYEPITSFISGAGSSAALNLPDEIMHRLIGSGAVAYLKQNQPEDAKEYAAAMARFEQLKQDYKGEVFLGENVIIRRTAWDRESVWG